MCLIATVKRRKAYGFLSSTYILATKLLWKVIYKYLYINIKYIYIYKVAVNKMHFVLVCNCSVYCVLLEI